MAKIAIFDYGAGNLFSLKSALERNGAEGVEIIYDLKEANRFDGLVLPGVGNFDPAIKSIERSAKHLDRAIESGKPVMGICLGMEMLFDRSEEGRVEGLKGVGGDVVMLPKRKVKIPHMGWNNLQIKGDSKLLKGVKNNSWVYFVHSYRTVPKNRRLVVATSDRLSPEEDQIYFRMRYPQAFDHVLDRGGHLERVREGTEPPFLRQEVVKLRVEPETGSFLSHNTEYGAREGTRRSRLRPFSFIDSVEKLRGLDVEDLCQPVYRPQRRRVLPALEQADVGPMTIRGQSQILLREILLQTQFPDDLAECLLGGNGSLRHGANVAPCRASIYSICSEFPPGSPEVERCRKEQADGLAQAAPQRP